MLASRTVLVLLGLALLAHATPVQKVNKRRPMIGGRFSHGLVLKPQESEFVPQQNYVAATFDNYIDHLNKSRGTYKQRYWTSEDFYKPGGPVFFMLGGESAESSYWVTDSSLPWVSFAKEQGAFLVSAEHRYYGQSRPTPDMSTENLLYLSSAQAIEDYANLIRGLQAKRPEFAKAKWVTFGGSYSGNLAAWMRIKHPELVSFAVGSSGPVTAELDFTQYMEVVQASIKSTSASCASSIASAMKQVASLLTAASGRTTLQSTFGICEKLDINDKKQIQNFWSTVFGPYMETVQYSGDNAGLFKNSLTIDHAICRFHNDNTLSSLSKLKRVNNYFNDIQGQFGCSSIDYNSMIQFYQNTDFDSDSADARAWVYQTCTEFGYYQTTDSTTAGPFWGGQGNVGIDFYVQQCADIYGGNFTQNSIAYGVGGTNMYYGGTQMNTTGIILPNGSYDPWHALGKLDAANQSGIVPVVITGTSHCADMYSPSSTDLPSLTSARVQIYDTLRSWLK